MSCIPRPSQKKVGLVKFVGGFTRTLKTITERVKKYVEKAITKQKTIKMVYWVQKNKKKSKYVTTNRTKHNYGD